MQDYLEEVKAYHESELEPYTGKPVGCSEAEVAALEQKFGFSLPLAYRQYLLWMGKDYDGVFVGCGWFARDAILDFDWLPEWLEESHVEFDLAEHYLAFMNHQGYMYAWFNLPRTDENPPVFFFRDDAGSVKVYEKFTDFLLADMKHMGYFTKRVRTERD